MSNYTQIFKKHFFFVFIKKFLRKIIIVFKILHNFFEKQKKIIKKKQFENIKKSVIWLELGIWLWRCFTKPCLTLEFLQYQSNRA